MSSLRRILVPSVSALCSGHWLSLRILLPRLISSLAVSLSFSSAGFPAPVPVYRRVLPGPFQSAFTISTRSKAERESSVGAEDTDGRVSVLRSRHRNTRCACRGKNKTASTADGGSVLPELPHTAAEQTGANSATPAVGTYSKRLPMRSTAWRALQEEHHPLAVTGRQKAHLYD